MPLHELPTSLPETSSPTPERGEVQSSPVQSSPAPVSSARSSSARSTDRPPRRLPEVIDGVEHRYQSVRLPDGSHQPITVRVLHSR